MAEEVAHKRMYNEKCDVYSFGVILYEILSLEVPFEQHTTIQSLFDNVWSPPYKRPNLTKVPYFADINNKSRSRRKHDDDELKIKVTMKDLIHKSWHFDLHQRPNMAKICDTLLRVAIFQKIIPDDVAKDIITKGGHHKRRKSHIIYDKHSRLFRINSNEYY